jgi:hypothetical protein
MGHLLKIKCIDSRVNVHILASSSVSFTLTTVQVQNLALTRTKWITVQQGGWKHLGCFQQKGRVETIHYLPSPPCTHCHSPPCVNQSTMCLPTPRTVCLCRHQPGSFQQKGRLETFHHVCSASVRLYPLLQNTVHYVLTKEDIREQPSSRNLSATATRVLQCTRCVRKQMHRAA